jgi:NTE family protein
MGKKIALALGSGGARGYAHIGVIKEIQAQGHEIVAIAGTSSGAMVGGLYAAGALDEFTDWVTAFSQKDVLLLLDPALKGPGAIRAEKVMSRVRAMLNGIQIEELPIDFTAVATDLNSMREIWFQEGPLHLAIRASIAIPSLITPVSLNGKILVDGGLLNPIPVAPLSAAGADLIIAVDLAGKDREALSSTSVQVDTRALSEAQLVAKVLSVPSDIRTIDILMKSLEAVQNTLARHQFSTHPADLVIEIPLNSCGTLEFYKAKEMIEMGRSTARKSIGGMIL